jgi:transposase
MVSGTKRKHSAEFKLEAIRLLKGDPRTGAMLARELGIDRGMLYRWERELRMGKKKPHRKAKPDDPSKAASTSSDSEELERLRERVKQLEHEKGILEEEKEILKKATAFFAKESR